MNIKSYFKRKRGFTLIEVLVSIALIALMATAILLTATGHVVYSHKVDKIYTASNLAKQRMDSLKQMIFSDLATQAPESDVRIDDTGEEDSSGDYMRTTEVEGDYDGNSYLVKIKVSVDRVEEGSASGNPVVIETLYADVD